MSNAPQGNGAGGAEGGHAVGFGNFDSTASVPNVDLGNGPLDNRIQNINITAIANDQPGDNDYDDPYPGGKSDGFDPAVPLG